MDKENIPNWLNQLNIEDVNFIKNFVMASGSLKDIAAIYSVTYPTVRIRLDKLIEKITDNDDFERDEYILLIKRLANEGKLSFETARILIHEYRKSGGEIR